MNVNTDVMQILQFVIFWQDEADAEDLEEDLMGARLDPFKLLEHMAAHETGQEQQGGIQPYEILANQARQARQKAEAKPKGRQKRPASSESSEVVHLFPFS